MKKMKWVTMEKAFPNFLTNGIFTYLDGFSVPWKEDALPVTLNIQYHANYSRRKIVSPLIDTFLDSNATQELTTEQKETLAETIWQIYKKPWVKLYDTLKFEYNPIENYDMKETSEYEDNESGNDVRRITDNENEIYVGDIVNSGSELESITYGKSETGSGTETKLETRNLTVSRLGTETESITYGKSETGSGTETKLETRNLTVSRLGTESESVTYGKSETGSNTGTQTTVNEEESHTTNNLSTAMNIAGFNSPTYVNDSQQTGNNTGSGTNDTTSTRTDNLNSNITQSGTDRKSSSNTGTETEGGTIETDANTSNIVTQSGTDRKSNNISNHTTNNATTSNTRNSNDTNTSTSTKNGSTTLHRHGNIGVTTSQQMIEQERQVWLWKYFDQIFQDIDSVLTSPIYIL